VSRKGAGRERGDASRKNWFDVDTLGLSKLIEDKSRIVNELVQNAWDEPTSVIHVELTPVDGAPLARLTVTDDAPDGWADLSHAYTLFAESRKKSDPEKRGFLNLGEKLVLALCTEAEVITTTGSVRFTDDGRTRGRHRFEVGSQFAATIRMTRAELAAAEASLRTLLPPKGKLTTVNGHQLAERSAIAEVEDTLETRIGGDDGQMRRTQRKALVRIYEPAEGEVGSIYEMGIPVVETGDRWHIDVQQKVPLNMNRDNVPPAFRRHLRVLALNACVERLTADDVQQVWVTEAAGDERVARVAAERVADLTWGKKRVAFDPNDPESAEKALTEGYSVIAPRGMSSEQRARLKGFGLLPSSSSVFATPQPWSDDPDAAVVERVPRETWTDGMRTWAAYVERAAPLLIGRPVTVSYVLKMNDNRVAASYARGSREMTFNLKALGRRAFDDYRCERLQSLMLHELAHEYSVSHFHEDYRKGLERIAGKLVYLSLSGAVTW